MVMVSSHRAFTSVQSVACWHQYSRSGGPHSSGPLAPFDRLAPAVTAMRWFSSSRSLAYSSLLSASHLHPPDRWAFFKGHQVVDVQAPGFLHVNAGEGAEPPAGLDPAFPVGLEGHFIQALFDQDLLPGVLAVAVRVRPVLPVVPGVVGDAREDGGDGDGQGNCPLRGRRCDRRLWGRRGRCSRRHLGR